MEWWQIHYRLGELWYVVTDGDTCQPYKYAFDTFARQEAIAMVEHGFAVEAMVVKVTQVEFCKLESRVNQTLTHYAIALPVVA